MIETTHGISSQMETNNEHNEHLTRYHGIGLGYEENFTSIRLSRKMVYSSACS